MKCRIFPAAIALLLCGRGAVAQFATRVVAYDATGANPNFVDPAQALGPPSAAATPTVPDNSGIVSVGAGGYLVLGFDRPLRHDSGRPDGLDFIVFGNAFYVGGDIHVRYQKPAYVEVGVDVNGSGYNASTPFYLLRGSPNPMSGFPFRGIDDRQFTTWGYANVTPTNGAGNPQTPTDPFASGISDGSAGGDAFSLTWAVDANGLPVTLDHVDFIRIRAVGPWYSVVDAVAVVASPLSGRIALQGVPDLSAIPAAVPLGTFRVEFRAPGTGTVLKSADVSLMPVGVNSPYGTLRVSGVPAGTYDVAVKGGKSLRVVLPNVAVSDGATLPDITLSGGDANNDNVVDIGDFGLLVNAYGSDVNSANSGYDPHADFDYNGVVDIGDFGLLVNNYGSIGAN